MYINGKWVKRLALLCKLSKGLRKSERAQFITVCILKFIIFGIVMHNYVHALLYKKDI